ncbi:unnamed protein product [Lasius platythorax]|uniref:Uncharacterized protein n=1 Tax=Lasius platythorax TaxID=488582 RepID=A0AAV2MWT2_9HYME
MFEDIFCLRKLFGLESYEKYILFGSENWDTELESEEPAAKRCGDFYHWRKRSHLCQACRRAPLIGRDLPTDPFWRACDAVFRCLDTPYCLKIVIDVESGVREVHKVVPVSHNLAWRIPALCIERAFLGRQPFPYYGEVPDALHIPVESVRIYARVTLRPAGGRGSSEDTAEPKL